MAVRSPNQAPEEWLLRLKSAYDAGYYQTEADANQQTLFPWQNKSCRDCPYWANSICRVHAEYRAAASATCMYFDECNREQAEDVIRERQWQGYRRWWEWFNTK
jgi:hypothetical protein